MKKILIIEDNKELVKTIEDLLLQNGYKCDYFFNTEDIDDYIILNKYDLVILDIMFEGTNGLEFCQVVRSEIETPIIFLSAKNKSDDIIKGLSVGADDYLTKPFENDVLIAKIKSILNRKYIYQMKILELDGYKFYENTKRLEYNGKVVNVSSTEFDILFILANSNKILSKEKIQSSIYKLSLDTDSRLITQYIYQIRKKLKEIGNDPIENIWGEGYKWKS